MMYSCLQLREDDIIINDIGIYWLVASYVLPI